MFGEFAAISREMGGVEGGRVGDALPSCHFFAVICLLVLQGTGGLVIDEGVRVGRIIRIVCVREHGEGEVARAHMPIAQEGTFQGCGRLQLGIESVFPLGGLQLICRNGGEELVESVVGDFALSEE